MAKDLSDDFFGDGFGEEDFFAGELEEVSSSSRGKGRRRKRKSRRVSEPSVDAGLGFGFSPDDDGDVGFGFGDEEDESGERKRSRRRERRKARGKPRARRGVEPVVDGSGVSGDDGFGDGEDEFFEEEGKKKSVGRSVVAPIVLLVTMVALIVTGVVVFAVKSDSESSVTAGSDGSSSVGSEPSSVEASPLEEFGSGASSSVVASPSVPSPSTSESVGVAVTAGTLGGSPVNKGDRSSGTDVILAYEYAYYHLRDDDAANGLFAGEPTVGIASKVSPDTKYEVKVTPKVIGSTYDVELTLDVNGKAKTYSMKATTKLVDGEYKVTSMKAAK